MTNRRVSRKRKKHAAKASSPPAASGRRRWPLAVVLTFILASLAAIIWYLPAIPWGREQQRESDAVRNSAPIPLGEPPVDAAQVLQLPVDLPQTAQECNEESLAVARLLVETLPERRESYAQLAFAHLQLGQDQASLNSWRKAIECDEKFADAYLGMGAILKAAGDNKAAIKSLRRAIQLDPSAQHAYRELIEALLRESLAEQALPVALECVRRFPDVCEHHFWLGQTYIQLKDYTKAKSAHEEAIRINPEFTLSYFPLSITCARLGQQEDAARYRKRFAEVKAAELERGRNRARGFDDFLTQRQALIKRHVLAGTFQLQYGDVRMAEAHWIRAANINPKELATRRALVSLYEQQNRAGAELKYLDELVQIDPENPSHMLRKARLLIALQSWSDVEETVEQALERYPDSAEAHLLLAEMHVRAGSDLNAAETHAEQAIRLDTTSQSLLLLAAIRGEQGDRTGALAALKQALSLDPTNIQARQTYEQLLELE